MVGTSGDSPIPEVPEALTKFTIGEISLTILFKFITSYNGDRDTLEIFLTNCDRTLLMASPSQTETLFKYILASLTDKAAIVCANHDIKSWKELKEILRRNFGERKHYAQLLMELQQTKQGASEKVASFVNRIETCVKDCLVCIKQTATTEMAKGKIESIEELSLQVFNFGIHSSLATILRARNPKTLNQAINIALEEERINKLQDFTRKRCGICNKDGHTANNCYKKSGNVNRNNRDFTSKFKNLNINTYEATKKICKFCKKEGHLIDKCYKRANQGNAVERPTSNFNWGTNAPVRPQNKFVRRDDKDRNPQQNFNRNAQKTHLHMINRSKNGRQSVDARIDSTDLL
ncbi:uncharacterized protein LOC143919597 [Arctopsyche grandis]|uniref:uncharacterized protein LOC143919597 n=1 Tax=Arctopsyche grandis TaxID=121162 RepID=UPI00406DA427